MLAGLLPLPKGQYFINRVGRKVGLKACLDVLSLLSLQAQLLLSQYTELCLCTQALMVVCVSSEHVCPLNTGDVGLGRKFPIKIKLWDELWLSIQNVEYINASRIFS